METEINSLVFNFMCDLKKKEINPVDKSKLIRQYLTDNNISIRELSRQTGIPHNTIEDWLLFEKITKTQYENYESEGFSKGDIYHSLRGGTLGEKPIQLDVTLKTCISKLQIFKIKPPYSKDTKYYLTALKKIIDSIEVQIK